MESLAAAYRKDKTLHHAYLVAAERESAIEQVCAFLEKEVGLERQGNSDFSTLRYGTLGIDDARELKSLASRKGFAPGKRIYIIAADFFTREAQNSLLKLLEEPTEGTHFFIVTEHTETLLPTLRSRLSEVALSVGEKSTDETAQAARHFATLAPDKRLLDPYARGIIEDKDKEKASRFIDELTAAFHSKAAAPEALNTLLAGKRFIADRSASVKLIIEHLALTLPVL